VCGGGVAPAAFMQACGRLASEAIFKKSVVHSGLMPVLALRVGGFQVDLQPPLIRCRKQVDACQ
jgi:hypothetical protein